MTIGLFELLKIAYFRSFYMVLINLKKAGAKQLSKCFTPTIDFEPKYLMKVLHYKSPVALKLHYLKVKNTL